jgi:anti-sigma regulatory factor (Ser/Thr protein kinase)
VTSLSLAPDPAAVRQARLFARSCCAGAGLEESALETVVLLTSEAVTNAFIHGRSEARLTVTVFDNRVLVEVGDDNLRHPRPADVDDAALDGRGLLLMMGLSARWGVRDEPIGKQVWFEVGFGPL